MLISIIIIGIVMIMIKTIIDMMAMMRNRYRYKYNGSKNSQYLVDNEEGSRSNKAAQSHIYLTAQLRSH